MIHSQIRFDIVHGKSPVEDVVAYLVKVEAKYYMQVELGEETGKPHWQGWATYDSVKENSFRAYLCKLCSKNGLCPKKKQYCFGKIRDFETYKGYILKNDTKKVSLDFRTNLSDEDLEVISSEALPFVSVKKQSIKKNTKSWFDSVLEKYEDRLVIKNLKNQMVIQYDILETIILETTPKSLDVQIFRRLIIGLGNYLERKYKNEHNVRFRHYLHKSLETLDPDLSLTLRV